MAWNMTVSQACPSKWGGLAHTCIIASFGTVTTSERKSRDALSLEAAHFSLRLAEKMVSVLLTATVMLGGLG